MLLRLRPKRSSTARGLVNQTPHELQTQDPEFDSDDESAPFEEIDEVRGSPVFSRRGLSDPELEARKRQRRDDALGF